MQLVRAFWEDFFLPSSVIGPVAFFTNLLMSFTPLKNLINNYFASGLEPKSSTNDIETKDSLSGFASILQKPMKDQDECQEEPEKVLALEDSRTDQDRETQSTMKSQALYLSFHSITTLTKILGYSRLSELYLNNNKIEVIRGLDELVLLNR